MFQANLNMERYVLLFIAPSPFKNSFYNNFWMWYFGAYFNWLYYLISYLDIFATLATKTGEYTTINIIQATLERKYH